MGVPVGIFLVVGIIIGHALIGTVFCIGSYMSFKKIKNVFGKIIGVVSAFFGLIFLYAAGYIIFIFAKWFFDLS